MDLGGIAAIGTVAVALMLAVWSIIGERSHLRQLERVSALISSVPAGSEERKVLEELRDDLAKREGLRRYGPAHPRQQVSGWFFVLAGAAFLVLAVKFWVNEVELWKLLIPYSIGFILTSVGHAVLQDRHKKRRQWESIEWARRLMSRES